jgi:hypothetical protein
MMGFDDEHNSQCNEEDFVDVVSVGSAPAVEPPFEIQEFPLRTAGAPIPGSDSRPSTFEAYQQAIGSNNNYAPFKSRLDWEIAQWAKMHKLSSSAVTQLLEIDGVHYYPIFLLNKINTTLQLSDMLGLSYRNGGELN